MKKLIPLICVAFVGYVSFLPAKAPPKAVEPNNPDLGSQNRNEMANATGTVKLPRGIVYVDVAPVVKNVTFVGESSIIRSTVANENALRVQGDTPNYVYAEPPANLPAGAVGYVWEFQWGFYKSPSQRFVGNLPSPLPPNTTAQKRGLKSTTINNTTTVNAIVLTAQNPAVLTVGQYVLVTDGPWINDWSGDWRKIVSITGNSVTLDRALPRIYRNASIIAGDWPMVMLKGVSLDADSGPFAAFGCPGLKIHDTVMHRNTKFGSSAGWCCLTQMGDVQIFRSRIDCGLFLNTVRDCHIRRCATPFIQAEEDCRGIVIDECEIGPAECVLGAIDSKSGCSDWRITNSWLFGNMNFYDGWLVQNCRIFGPGNVQIRGGGVVMRDVVSDSPVSIISAYQGSPVGAGLEITLDNVSAPYIQLGPGTSGKITKRSCPVVGDTSRWVITPRLN